MQQKRTQPETKGTRDNACLFVTHLKGAKQTMDSAMINKIQKAKRYATEERNRIHVQALKVTFDGANNPHDVSFDKGTWHCDCDFYQTRGVCVHSMALEMIFEDAKVELVK
jgi:hypothetical protein